MGGLDWGFSTFGMYASNAASLSYLLYAKSQSATSTLSLQQLWVGLAIFMGGQVATGIGRFVSNTGVWKVMSWSEEEEE